MQPVALDYASRTETKKALALALLAEMATVPMWGFAGERPTGYSAVPAPIDPYVDQSNSSPVPPPAGSPNCDIKAVKAEPINFRGVNDEVLPKVVRVRMSNAQGCLPVRLTSWDATSLDNEKFHAESAGR